MTPDRQLVSLKAMLADLLEWSTQTGGWDAPC
jgi:hypothetical protein